MCRNTTLQYWVCTNYISIGCVGTHKIVVDVQQHTIIGLDVQEHTIIIIDVQKHTISVLDVQKHTLILLDVQENTKVVLGVQEHTIIVLGVQEHTTQCFPQPECEESGSGEECWSVPGRRCYREHRVTGLCYRGKHSFIVTGNIIKREDIKELG